MLRGVKESLVWSRRSVSVVFLGLHLMKCRSEEAVQFLAMHPTGSPDFLVRGCGAYAQSRRSWSSQSPIVHVSHRWLLGLMACSLVASLA
ncbi:hypothetical protein DY000_02057542 [Brassica cretica]|uniref:Secreted protein n=2 Tax=Brassica cretica TaxID=69181 RepID=A0ABQ7AAA8_BRACR|nr:hypothetical protein DY000_02057542 [Brassica cretica]